jgi:hypothetical protein
MATATLRRVSDGLLLSVPPGVTAEFLGFSLWLWTPWYTTSYGDGTCNGATPYNGREVHGIICLFFD